MKLSSAGWRKTGIGINAAEAVEPAASVPAKRQSSALSAARGTSLPALGIILWQSLFPSKEQTPYSDGAQEQYSEQKSSNEGADEARAVAAAKYSIDERLATYTMWLAIFTALLVLVAIFQIGFLVRTDKTSTAAANAAKQSADVAERTFTELERPYIFVDTPKFIPSPIEGALNVQYILKNYGRTPAIVRWLKATAKPASPSNNGPLTWIEIFSGQIILKSGDEREIQPLHRMPFPKTPAIGEPSVLLIIEVTYSDVFDYIHVSEFTFFESEGSFHAIAGKKYNRSKSEKLPEGVEWTPVWSEKKRE